MNIELVTTANATNDQMGFGAERTCQQFVRAAASSNFSVRLSHCESLNDLDDVVLRSPDLVVLGARYLEPEGQEKVWLSAYFSDRGIFIAGSPYDAVTRASDKLLAKRTLTALGLPTAAYFDAMPGVFKSKTHLPLSFPLFVKPTGTNNGKGVDDGSYVTSFVQFEEKLVSIERDHACRAVAEEYLGGREFTVAIIDGHDDVWVAPVEITPPRSSGGLRIMGAEVKRAGSAHLSTISDSELKSRVSAFALEVFRGLGARGFGRIDIRTSDVGECFFLAANLVPEMSADRSYFPLAFALELRHSYVTVVRAMIASATPRTDGRRAKFDCLSCGACCFQRPGTILVSADDLTRFARLGRSDILEQMEPGHFSQMAFKMARSGACVHHGTDDSPHACRIYEIRGDTCRDFEVGSWQCVEFRRERGLATEEPDGRLN